MYLKGHDRKIVKTIKKIIEKKQYLDFQIVKIQFPLFENSIVSSLFASIIFLCCWANNTHAATVSTFNANYCKHFLGINN